MKKYSEEIIRHPAVTEEGQACEILERVTFAHPLLADGSAGDGTVINRRFDLRTGECLNRINETEFVDQISGAKVSLA